MVIDTILKRYRNKLGDAYQPYRNHAHRVYQYALILLLKRDSKKLEIAAAYHDLDIWLSQTMNYLKGSEAEARKHIEINKLDLLPDEVGFIIRKHHKLTRIKGSVEAEAFRKADLIDLSAGWISYNIPKSIIKDTENQYPRLGFTKLVLKKTFVHALKHPLNPFPMLRF